MNYLKIIIFCACVLASLCLEAQNSRSDASGNVPNNKEEKKLAKEAEKKANKSRSLENRDLKRMKKGRGYTPKGMLADDKNLFLEKRQKENAQQREEMRTNPTYADKMYFGHKKKPKKRPVGKRKFCQECGITH